MKRIHFCSFLFFLHFNHKDDYKHLYVGKKSFLLRNKTKKTYIRISDIISVKIEEKKVFSDIIIATGLSEYKINNVLLFNPAKMKELLDCCINFEFAEKDFKLFKSVTNGTQYVSNSLKEDILNKISSSIIYKYQKFALDDERAKKCKRYIKLFNNYKKNCDVIIQNNNERFMQKELEDYKDFFDKLEENPLTQMQRVSIITEEDNNLVVAGAGSGKTSVISGKVLYLLKKKLAEPSEILVLTFNKKAQEEISARLADKLDFLPDVKTFHGIGNYILKQGNNKNSLSKIATDDLAYKNAINSIIKNNLEYEAFANIIKTYFQEFFYPMPNISAFTSEGEYYDYLESFDIRTLNGEKVRSLEECYIANFLYLNGISYEYEYTYPYDCGVIYKPDFYLTDYNIYIEHFAINKKGITPPFIECKRYVDGIKWKRKTHDVYGTTLVETYSWENYDGVLLKNLEKKLRELNVEFYPIKKEDIFVKLNNVKHVDSFTELASTFLNHFKSNQISLESLFKKNIQILSALNSEKDELTILKEKRNQAFLNVFETINAQYEKMLKDNNENDFNDMILLATKFLQLGIYKPNYKYILVDEFQDISKGRALLLKALRGNNTKLFCVGDDWQSIYRFAGSDIALMTKFSQEFGYTKRIDLDMTFRFDNQINDVATKFIMQNKNQLKKEIRTIKKSETPSVLIYYEDPNSDSIKAVLAEIMGNIQDKSKNNVLILSRFNKLRDNDLIVREEFKAKLDEYKKSFPDLNISFSSIHGSKGLGFDYVVLIDMNRGAFPLEKIDDHILSMVMPIPDDYKNAEERRLFYVALTRAKEKIYLIPSAKPSSFIEELESDSYNVGIYGNSDSVRKLKCPKCKTGLLIKSNSQKSFICSHVNYCDFMTPVCDNCGKGYIKYDKISNTFECSNPRCHEKRIKCPLCEDGYLIKREGQYGEFYGCSNYPKCNYTKNINTDKKIEQGE